MRSKHSPRLSPSHPPSSSVAAAAAPPSSLPMSAAPAPRRPSCLRIVMFSTTPYEKAAFDHALSATQTTSDALEFNFVSAGLDASTVSLAANAQAVCLFATDDVDNSLLSQLHALGVRLVALRYAGVPVIDVDKASRLGISVARTPAHAATSIAEYTVTLMLALNRKVHVASSRVRDGNFSLNGLVGFDMRGKTVGIVGMGRVGRIVAQILTGFGCKILAYDVLPGRDDDESKINYVSMQHLLTKSDILSLHAPLVPGTLHMLGRDTLQMCKKGVYVVNTSRGGLIDIRAMIDCLSSGQVGGLAMDVYEGEKNVFFKDYGGTVDMDFQVLSAMPNVLITGRQSSLTTNALESVAYATVRTLMQFYNGEELEFVVPPDGEKSNGAYG